MTIRVYNMHGGTKDKAAQIRDAIKAEGIKANVRFFNRSYRIVLPAFTEAAGAQVCDVLNRLGLRTVSGEPLTGEHLRFFWDRYDGRGQCFAYDLRPVGRR